ncbi:MAG: hypothetical protein PHG96_02975 [Kiritimatiellae bacterium]|nr:hypothetical protein [Kiritimatiellia bacterium]
MTARGDAGCARRVFLRMLALAASGLPTGCAVWRTRAALALDDRDVGRMAWWAG